jgi:hypothetical protein
MNELDELVLRLRALVREEAMLRRSGASGASLSASSREIESLKSRLAHMIRRDPAISRPRRVRPGSG